MDFYPISTFPYALTIVGVGVTVALGLWVAHKDQSARPIGLVAFMPIVFVTGWTWFRVLPEWTAWLSAVAVAVLFIVGMTKHEDKDDKWHYGALVVALFGKLVFWFLPWLWSLVTNDFTIKGPVFLLILALVGLVAIGVWIGWYFWQRGFVHVDDESEPATT